MTDQVTSIEQSKRLIELGVPADKASMVWEWGWVCGTVDEENYELKIWQECKLDKILAYQNFPNLLSRLYCRRPAGGVAESHGG